MTRHSLEISLGDQRDQFTDSVFLENGVFTLQTHDQIILLRRMENNQLISARSDADSGQLEKIARI